MFYVVPLYLIRQAYVEVVIFEVSYWKSVSAKENSSCFGVSCGLPQWLMYAGI